MVSEPAMREARGARIARRRVLRRPRLVRAAEWLLPVGARLLHGGYFSHGLERRVCRVIHRAAARGTLYGFAPPPPLTRVAAGAGGRRADEYRFRSPFVSHVEARNDAHLRHYRGEGAGRPLVLWNHGTGALRTIHERLFVRRLLAGGIDVAVPVAPGFGCRRGPRDRRRGWAATVGGALSAIVQLVHDNVAVESWARGLGYRVVAVAGIGLGGVVAALLAATTTRFDVYVPMLAGAHPGRLWLPPRALARAVDRRALMRAGIRNGRTLARLFDPVAPVRLARPRARLRCAIVGFSGDTLVPPADVRDLAAHWRVTPTWLARAHVELPLCARDLAAIVLHLTREAST
jgi:hypothetical protein